MLTKFDELSEKPPRPMIMMLLGYTPVIQCFLVYSRFVSIQSR